MTKPELADTELSPALKKLGAAIAQREARDAARPVPAKIVQFPIPFPEDKPPVCNLIARTSLFAAIQGKDRRTMKRAVVASRDGVEIAFSGEQWNQDDHDTFMILVALASTRPLGQHVTIPANAILRALGRGTGKSQHLQLKADMHRLLAGTVEIRANGIYYAGHLVDDIAQDEREPEHKRHWVYRINPKMAALFARNQFTLNNFEARQQLGQKYLAKWLQLWIESNAQQYPTGVETIRDRSGSQTSALKHFRAALKRALTDLQAVGIITGWEIDAGDLAHIARKPTGTQAKHIRLKEAKRSRLRTYAAATDPRSDAAWEAPLRDFPEV